MVSGVTCVSCATNTQQNEETLSEAKGDYSNAETEAINEADNDENSVIDISDITKIGSMDLSYATQFRVDYYEGGYAHISIADGCDYVLVPEGAADNNLGIDNTSIIHMPITSTYLAASAAMDLFRELDALESITACSTKAEDYSIDEARELIEQGVINYVGKYSAPDYEKLLELGTDIAIESSMIYHSPKVKEELESFGIPVLVERSSYEEEPLGRLEWIKLFGLLIGNEDKATEIFDAQVQSVERIIATTKANNEQQPKVAFFYVSSNGYVNVRKPGDYISKMIEIAGGKYALDDLLIDEENALSTVNISWEDFYAFAKDADILIYNGTIDGGIKNISELIDKSELMNDFNAVKSGRVYCTNNNMYQETSKMGDIICELCAVINDTDDELKYIRKVNY